MSDRYDLCVPREYESNGEKKTAWDNVGVMFKRDKGGYSVRLSKFPELHIMAFPPKEDREERPKQARRDDVRKSNDSDEIPF